MRAFIAIELHREAKDFLRLTQEKLKASGADVKWVHPQNIHLTLKFLGEINDKKINEIIPLLEEIAENRNPFRMRITSIGAFPKISSPRVIWVGIDKGKSETEGIARDLEEGMQKIGIPKEERAFSSHITIGRARSGLNRERLVQSLKTLENNPAEFKEQEFLAAKIILFKSTLTPKGPVYEPLKEANLKAS